MAIKKIRIDETDHELQTTIANVDGLTDTLNGKLNTTDIEEITSNEIKALFAEENT